MSKSAGLDEDKKIEGAISFLVQEYPKSGKNPKPVVLHSLRVAFYLLGHGYPPEVVIAAALHDLVEDSDVTLDMIRVRFGDQAAKLVGAVSFNPEIADRRKRDEEMFHRVKACGREALLIKCADIYDNSFYIDRVEDMELMSYLVGKMGRFLSIAKPIIGKERVWLELRERYDEEKQRVQEKPEAGVG